MENRENMPPMPDREEGKKEATARPGGFMRKARKVLGVGLAAGVASLGSPAEAGPAQAPQTELPSSGEKADKSGEYFFLGGKIDIVGSKPTEGKPSQPEKAGESRLAEITRLNKEFGLNWNQEEQILTLPGHQTINYRDIDKKDENDPSGPGELKIEFKRNGDLLFITYYEQGIRQEIVIEKQERS